MRGKTAPIPKPKRRPDTTVPAGEESCAKIAAVLDDITAKRRALVQALARQTAREMFAEAMAQRD
ncbi:hypothetical protein [Acidocella aromatica]|uniref:Uncharacterized protein n=1 Tax=Acidocella aromatica TaxID=1303579 RepID=A0A840VMZ5_9PROT|nr:hypothetical protein [Acidocella aromatica]MBB5374495.1 hypothetical protein [Acidocella aromatica]